LTTVFCTLRTTFLRGLEVVGGFAIRRLRVWVVLSPPLGAFAKLRRVTF